MILNKSKFIFFLCCVLLWMAVIFEFSSERSEQSDKTSLGVGQMIAEMIVDDFDLMTEAEQQEMIETWNFAIRKTAHFCEYAILAVLTMLLFGQIKISRRLAVIAALLVSALYAVTDEVHQYFVPGRACQIRDVCIDTSGAATGIFVMLLSIRMCKGVQEKFRKIKMKDKKRE